MEEVYRGELFREIELLRATPAMNVSFCCLVLILQLKSDHDEQVSDLKTEMKALLERFQRLEAERVSRSELDAVRVSQFFMCDVVSERRDAVEL